MGWTDEVHTSRVGEAIGRARRERQLRKKGAAVVEQPNAGAAAFLLATAASGAFLLWKRYEKQLATVKWLELPVIKQFDELLHGKRVRSRSSAPAAPRRAAAAAPTAVARNTSSSSNRPAPVAAAAAAAAARAAGATPAIPAPQERPKPVVRPAAPPTTASVITTSGQASRPKPVAKVRRGAPQVHTRGLHAQPLPSVRH